MFTFGDGGRVLRPRSRDYRAVFAIVKRGPRITRDFFLSTAVDFSSVLRCDGNRRRRGNEEGGGGGRRRKDKYNEDYKFI